MVDYFTMSTGKGFRPIAQRGIAILLLLCVCSSVGLSVRHYSQCSIKTLNLGAYNDINKFAQ